MVLQACYTNLGKSALANNSVITVSVLYVMHKDSNLLFFHFSDAYFSIVQLIWNQGDSNEMQWAKNACFGHTQQNCIDNTQKGIYAVWIYVSILPISNHLGLYL